MKRDIFEANYWPGEEVWLTSGEAGLERITRIMEFGYTEEEAVFLAAEVAQIDDCTDRTRIMKEIRELAPTDRVLG